MKASTKIALAAALIGTLGAVIGTVKASPAQNSLQVAQVSDGDGEANDATEAHENFQRSHQSMSMMAMNDVSMNAKIAEANDGDGETNDDAEEQQETAKLQPLAKITAQQAQQAAEASVGSKASSVQLENEDGNLVYEVKIGQQEVKVDAGNGKVLYTENANQEGDEASEASRPKSSIQVPQNNDGDRENNENRK